MFLLAFSLISQIWASTLLQQMDQKVYFSGLEKIQSLSFSLTAPELLKNLNDQKTFGTMTFLKFNFSYQRNPAKLDIYIEGMPEGFEEIKAQLKTQVTGVMDFVLPLNWKNRFKNYQITEESAKNVLYAKDPTGINKVISYEVAFDTNSLPKSVIAKEPILVSTQYFYWERGPVFDPKWGLKKIETTAQQGIEKKKSLVSFEMQVIDGFPMPKRVKIETTIEMNSPQKELNTKRSQVEEYIFSNYKVVKSAQ
jgi:hypothetical protein